MNTNFIYRLLGGVNSDTSSKRFLMLYLGVIVWTFIHVMAFFYIKPFPTDIANTLIMGDLALIGGLAGLTVGEKVWGGKTPPTQPASDTNKQNT